MSELVSIALFLASVTLYSWKAGRNAWWFSATLAVLGLFVVLNLTLYASNYFTGDGINDAVLYTLTNSLTGAGFGKYLLPGAGLILTLVLVFGGLGWLLRRRRRPHHFGYSLLALCLALASVDASPAFRQLTELVKSQARDGDPDFAAWYKEPSKTIPHPQLNLVYIYGESLERTLKQIKPVHKLHSRNTEQAAFVVLKSPSIPSVLVETSFITNPGEEKLLGTTAFRQKIANAIASGVISYFHWFDNQKAHSRKR